MHPSVSQIIEAYCQAINRYDLKAALSYANYPCIFVGHGKVIACKDTEEATDVFNWIFDLHRRNDLAKASFEILQEIDQGPQGSFAVVRWKCWNSKEELIWDFEASYNLFQSANGLKIAAFTAHT